MSRGKYLYTVYNPCQGWAHGSPVQPEQPPANFTVEPEKNGVFQPGKTGTFQPEPPGKFPVQPGKTVAFRPVYINYIQF